jgi:hypothetical protein
MKNKKSGLWEVMNPQQQKAFRLFKILEHIEEFSIRNDDVSNKIKDLLLDPNEYRVTIFEQKYIRNFYQKPDIDISNKKCWKVKNQQWDNIKCTFYVNDLGILKVFIEFYNYETSRDTKYCTQEYLEWTALIHISDDFILNIEKELLDRFDDFIDQSYKDHLAKKKLKKQEKWVNNFKTKFNSELEGM